jgi:hypothetical protein
MARTASAPIRTRTERNRLTPRSYPYFLSLDLGLTLGYERRKAPLPGRWFARALVDGNHVQHLLGVADTDALPADGVHTLTFAQATKAAHAWAGDRQALRQPADADGRRRRRALPQGPGAQQG